MSNYLGNSNYSTSLDSQTSQTALTFELPALGPTSADRILYASDLGPAIADKDVINTHDRILGWTLNAVSAAGDILSVIAEGYVENTSWTFIPGPIYLSNIGETTQVAPTTGIRVQVATAITATSIYVDIGVAIKLA